MKSASQKAEPTNPSVNRRFENTGVHVSSVSYAEPNGAFGAGSALTFPNFFPKLAADSALMAVEEEATHTWNLGEFETLRGPATSRIYSRFRSRDHWPN